jgi:hypothetical protein
MGRRGGSKRLRSKSSQETSQGLPLLNVDSRKVSILIDARLLGYLSSTLSCDAHKQSVEGDLGPKKFCMGEYWPLAADHFLRHKGAEVLSQPFNGA